MQNYYKKTINIVMSIILTSVLIIQADVFDTVNHKNIQLGLYLDAIQYNLHEKIGILPFLLKKESGNFLEIGTGGDPIANMFNSIPKDMNVTIVASDVDQLVLNSLLIRHPELYQYLDDQVKPKLYLQQLNAMDMHCFTDNYFDGINASSVVHEIVSYSGGLSSCRAFFNEAFRVLKPNGILVYRDPEFIKDKEEIVCVSLLTKSLKLFAHIFLYKFLNYNCSLLAKSGTKFCLYNTNLVKFNIFTKNSITPMWLSYEEYLKIPSYDIDFSRDFKIEMPAGLNRELLRHYLTYLHQCNPLVFIKTVPNIANQNYGLSFYAHSTVAILKEFFKKNNNELDDCALSLQQKCLIEEEIEKNNNVLEFGIPLQFLDQKQKIKLRSLLQEYGFNQSYYIIAIDHNKYILDYPIFGLLFDQISELFNDRNKPINSEDQNHALWLKREGEESYCYYYYDELIAHVLYNTYRQSSKSNLMALCPMLQGNIFVERWCYTELLKEICWVQDIFGYKHDIFDGKRIIHFQKMPIKEALEVCHYLIQENPMQYSLLKKIVQDIKKDLECTMNY